MELIAYILTLIGVTLEIIGISKTYKELIPNPKEIVPLTELNRYEDGELVMRDGDNRRSMVNDKINDVVKQYNTSVKHIIDENNRVLTNSRSYFGMIAIGFGLQAIATVLFIIKIYYNQELDTTEILAILIGLI